MFDIGFWEITVIAVVALLVVGPEQLPGLLRTAGRWVGNAKRLIGEAKAELDLEVERAEKIKQRMAEEARIAEMHRALGEGRSVLDETIRPPAGTTPSPAPGVRRPDGRDDAGGVRDEQRSG